MTQDSGALPLPLPQAQAQAIRTRRGIRPCLPGPAPDRLRAEIIGLTPAAASHRTAQARPGSPVDGAVGGGLAGVPQGAVGGVR
ncbi:hypothetical protein AB0K62_30760 [Streptomyces halstedii]|uniref:hypothetical protein n=1 Tax=Streptomyces halstedii TaxID=1944 RepID=UPI00345F757C